MQRNNNKDEPKQTETTKVAQDSAALPKIAPKSPSKIFSSATTESPYMQSTLDYTADGISCTKLYAKDLGMNLLENSAINIGLATETGPILWTDSGVNELKSADTELKSMLTQDEALTNFALNVANNSETDKSYHLYVDYNTPMQDTKVQIYNETGKMTPDRHETIAMPWWAGFSKGYFGNYAIGNFDKAELNITNDQYNLRLVKTLKVAAHSVATFSFKALNMPLTILGLQGYNHKVEDGKFNLDKILDLGSGFFGNIFAALIYPVLYVFEYLTKLIHSPLVAMILMILLIKLILVYSSYSSYSFGKELSETMKSMSSAKTPEEVRDLFTGNKKLNIKSKIVSIVIKFALLIIFYNVFKMSAMFVKVPFLWIQDLSAPDPLMFTNLFGLIPDNPITNFLPKLSVLPVLVAGTLLAEMYSKGSFKTPNSSPNDQYIIMGVMSIFIAFIFSRMQAVICIYILVNTLTENLQNNIFDRIDNRTKGIKSVKSIKA